MAPSPPDLLIVYNANGGPFAALADALHKAISPVTYPCSLCAVTYGAVSMKGPWRHFLATLPNAKRFYHRDDFAAAFPGFAVPLPAILTHREAETPQIVISAAELDRLDDLDALIGLLGVRLARL